MAVHNDCLPTVYGTVILDLIRAHYAAVYAHARAPKHRREQTYMDVYRAERRLINAFAEGRIGDDTLDIPPFEHTHKPEQ